MDKGLMPQYWDSFIEDSLELPNTDGPLENAVAYNPEKQITDDIIRSYFLEGKYPYTERMKNKEYYLQKYLLQVELVKLQNWFKDTGQKIVIVFEGRDAAGKGSSIKRFIEHMNPRGYRVVALEKPNDTERNQWYFQRYVIHMPSSGEIVFFDRSWYNRAGVERVMGFCSKEEYWEFTRQTPKFEEMLVNSGVKLIKFYLSVSKAEQARRFHDRETNPLKQWKLSPIDKEAQDRWDGYTEAKETTFKLTHTKLAPWTIVKSEDQQRAKLNAIRHVLHLLNYEGKDEAIAVKADPLIVAGAATIFSLDSE